MMICVQTVQQFNIIIINFSSLSPYKIVELLDLKNMTKSYKYATSIILL